MAESIGNDGLYVMLLNSQNIPEKHINTSLGLYLGGQIH